MAMVICLLPMSAFAADPTPFYVGNAMHFADTDDSLSTGYLTTQTDNITMEAWVNADTLSNAETNIRIMYNGDSGGTGYGIYLTGANKLPSILVGGIGFAHTDRTLSTSQWYHLAAVRNSGAWTFYINGVACTNLTYDGTLTNSTDPNIPGGADTFTIGNRPAVIENFTGKIDEVRFWTVARTAAQIKDNMYIKLDGTETDLRAYYNFDQTGITAEGDNTGITTVADLAGGDNGLNITGFALTGTTSNFVKSVALGSFALSSDAYSVGASGGTLSIPVNRTDGSEGAVTLNYTVEQATGDTAVAGTNFTAVNGGTVTFAGGVTTQNITVSGIANGTGEQKTFTVSLLAPVGVALGANSSAKVTIPPYSYDIAGGSITIADGTNADTLQITQGAAPPIDNIPKSTPITIYGGTAASPSGNRVSVNATREVKLTINELHITSTASPISLAIGANVSLTLAGESKLEATDWNYPGVAVPDGASLTITGANEATDKLKAIGGRNSAGIGSGTDPGSVTLAPSAATGGLRCEKKVSTSETVTTVAVYSGTKTVTTDTQYVDITPFTPASAKTAPVKGEWDADSKGTATWTAITGESGDTHGYRVYLYKLNTVSGDYEAISAANGGVKDVAAGKTSLDLLSVLAQNGSGSYKFTVSTRGDGTDVRDSAESEKSDAYAINAPSLDLSAGRLIFTRDTRGLVTVQQRDDEGNFHDVLTDAPIETMIRVCQTGSAAIPYTITVRNYSGDGVTPINILPDGLNISTNRTTRAIVLNANASVALTLLNSNTIKADEAACIDLGDSAVGAYLTIQGDGTLDALITGSGGVGCVNSMRNDSKLTIKSGTVTFRSNDGVGIKNVNFTVNGGTVKLSGTTRAIDSINTTFSPAADKYFKMGLSEASFSDAESNTRNIVSAESFSDVQDFVTITTHGRPVLPTPAAGAWAASTPARATWTAAAGAGSYSVQLYKNGTALGSAHTTAELYYDFASDVTAAGAYTFKVTALPAASSADMASAQSTVSDTYSAYAITYELDGGDEGRVQPVPGGPYVGNPEYCHAGTAAFTLLNPAKFGYDFTGWTGSNGTTPSTSVTVTPSAVSGALSYTANWTARNYTVVYDGNGSTGGNTASSTHTYDAAKKLTANGFERKYTVTYDHNYTGDSDDSATAAYSFNGWNTNANGTGTSYTDKESVTNLAPIGAFTLYAQWTSASVTLPTLTRTYYTFGGWYSDAACTDAKLVGAGGASYTPTAGITLYAKWTPNSDTYTVAVSANPLAGGTVTGGGTFGAGSHTVSATANVNYEFVEWREGGVQVSTSQSYTFTLAGDRTLVAVFSYTGTNPPPEANGISGITSGKIVTQGENVTFTANGGGMPNNNPGTGDKWWLPTHWETNPSGDFSTGFTQSFSTAGMTIGAHTLTVTFTQQRYNGTAWVNTGATNTRSVSFTVKAASVTPTTPVITDPTAAKTVTKDIGGKATLTVTATGTAPLAYQWQINKGSGWSDITGATDSSYTTSALKASNDGYKYRCTVTNSANSSTSPVFTLKVTDPDNPVMGDTSMPWLWIGLMALAGLAFTAVVFLKKRRANVR